ERARRPRAGKDRRRTGHRRLRSARDERNPASGEAPRRADLGSGHHRLGRRQRLRRGGRDEGRRPRLRPQAARSRVPARPHEAGAYTGADRKTLGLLAEADGGTVFIDEIGEMPLALQSKLLRFLQTKEFRRVGSTSQTRVDVRVITATNRALETEVTAGRFRRDLFYRINVFPIRVPPLRERREDVPLLADHFIRVAGKEMGRAIEPLKADALAV